MTQNNLQEKISAIVTDKFSDYYPFAQFPHRFPHIKDESGDILGIIIPDDFHVFKSEDFGGLPIVLYPINTVFVADDGYEYDTRVYVVEKLYDNGAERRAALRKLVTIAAGTLALSWALFA